MDPKRRLKNINVSIISLVDKGANLKQILFKSKDSPEIPTYSTQIKILKTDPAKRMVYGIVYSPEETDSQGDIASAEEIEKASQVFMKNGRTNQVDKQHDGNPDEGFIAENWITREGDALFKDSAPEGSWAVGIKVEDNDTWSEVEKGEITGLSLAGSAQTKDLENETPGLFKSILDKIRKGLFADKVKSVELRRKGYAIIDAFSDAIYSIMDAEFTGDRVAAIKTTVEELKSYVDKEFSDDLAAVAKAGRVLSAKNEKSIRAAYDTIKTVLDALDKENIKKEEGPMDPKELIGTDEFKTALADVVKTAVEAAVEPVKKDLGDQISGVQTSVTEVKDQVAKTDTVVADLKKSAGSDQEEGDETDPAPDKDPNLYKDKDGKTKKHVWA